MLSKMKHLECMILVAVLFGLQAPALAVSDYHGYAPHVHGVGELTVVLEGSTLEIAFQSPAMNLVGFEHVATTKQQKNRVKQTEALMKLPAKLFAFKGSGCEAKRVEVDVSSLLDEKYESHDHEGDHEHHTHHHEKAHADVMAHYQFNCAQPVNLSAVSVNLFKQFGGLEELHVMWVTARQQQADKLTPKNNTIYLR